MTVTVKYFPSVRLAQAEMVRVQMHSTSGLDRLGVAQILLEQTFEALCETTQRVEALEKKLEAKNEKTSQ